MTRRRIKREATTRAERMTLLKNAALCRACRAS
jgi:hypothetical protein